jgi:hypothetical protein
VLETLAKMNPVYPPVPKEVADLRKLLKR